MTYSVVLRDSATGALGVAVQSHWFNVASVVPWVEAGVGAIATQSVADPMYGPRALALMRDGVGATDALERLLAADESSHLRQVAIVDSTGSVAAHTGSGCIPHASHVTGDGWSVQGNIMRNDRVVPAMAAAAEASRGSVSDRLFAVLAAAEAAGGDLRGSQSAAMLVSGDGPVPAVRLSVEDHADPIGELGRLLEIRQMYDDMEAGDEALADADPSRAAAAYRARRSVFTRTRRGRVLAGTRAGDGRQIRRGGRNHAPVGGREPGHVGLVGPDRCGRLDRSRRPRRAARSLGRTVGAAFATGLSARDPVGLLAERAPGHIR